MKTRFLFGCILLFCSFFPGLRAQDTEFWFVAPHMSESTAGPYNIPLNRPAFLAISNNTFQTATIKITMYNGGSPIILDRTIASGSLYKLDFDTTDDYTNNKVNIKHIENPRGSAGGVTEFGVHVESDVRVTASYVFNHTESRDIFSLKGSKALGTQFYVPMQSDNAVQTGGYSGACDQIDIVATVDGTVVTVVPKATVRIGTSDSSAANTPITQTLDKGQTLKIMEYTVNSGSLTGTSITATQPIAVTVTEDLVHGDTSGDQIVPVASLGTRYIVPRGYRTDTGLERFYLMATEAGTNVNVYATVGATAPTTQISLTAAGQAARYTFPTAANAVYVESNKPVYVYQRTGYGEEGAALLPSVYSIGQTKMSFYQVSGYASSSNPLVQKGFLVFRTGTQAGFRITYGSGQPAAMSLSPLDIPNVPEWKIARFDFSAAPSDGQVIKIENEQSAFALGYITGNVTNNDSYGYFSAFGEFEFPAITYMCGSAVTIQGGYAKSYEWSFKGEVISTESSIVATEEGEYTLVMNQDPNIVTATAIVQKVNAGVVSPADTVICTGMSPGTLSVSGASELAGTQYQWQYSYDNENWTDITSGATSPAYAPGPLTQTTWYRRGMTSDYCALAYTYALKVRVSPCTLPVNPHLMIRYR